MGRDWTKMDPNVALAEALAGNSQAVKDYNAWIQRGGFASRVSIDPETDLFMRGVKYAEVRWIGRKYVTLTEETVRGRYTGKLSRDRVTPIGN